VARNHNKFYTVQALAKGAAGPHFVFKHWGRIGTAGQVTLMTFGDDKAAALKEFQKTLQSKTSKGYVSGAQPWASSAGGSTAQEEASRLLAGRDFCAMDQLGRKLSLAGEIDTPIALLRRAVELCPGNASYTNNLAWTVLQRRAFAEAEAMLRHGLTLGSLGMTRCNLGLVLALQGKPLLQGELDALKTGPQATASCTRRSAVDQYRRNAISKWRADAADDDTGGLAHDAKVASEFADSLMT
jgi:predicted DNA-binding WGR domain protein